MTDDKSAEKQAERLLRDIVCYFNDPNTFTHERAMKSRKQIPAVVRDLEAKTEMKPMNIFFEKLKWLFRYMKAYAKCCLFFGFIIWPLPSYRKWKEECRKWRRARYRPSSEDVFLDRAERESWKRAGLIPEGCEE